MAISSVFRCSLCHEPLQEDIKEMVCSFCGTREEGEWSCPNNHYTCEVCRLACPAELIERVCGVTSLQDPVALANVLMSHVAFNAHGPEHHLIVAPVVLTVLANASALSFDKTRLPFVIKRTADIPIGVCSSRGECGACVGVGAAFSFISRLISAVRDSRSLALRATALALFHLADMGGHRCCKQSVYASLEISKQILNDSLKIPTPFFPDNITCAFFKQIKDCKKKRCPYYPHE